MKSEPPFTTNTSSGAKKNDNFPVEPDRADIGSALRKVYPGAFQQSDHTQIVFHCGEGWLEIIRTLCSLLAEANRHETEQQTYLTEVKEKLGTLRVLVSGRSRAAHEWIRFAHQHSTHVCEVCGGSARLIYKDGWQRVRCDAHTSSPVSDFIN
jgi:hypothetical protein